MRIVCPSCRAAYEVPDTLLAGGKAVRCAKCGAEWTPPSVTPASPPQPPPPAAPPEEAEAPARIEPRLSAFRPRSVDSLDDARPPPRDDEIEFAPRRRGALIAWLLSLLVLAALIWAAFAFRGAVMGAWPPSTRLYAALGLH
jgi:predicted Zn finger-like uncharacterized protein